MRNVVDKGMVALDTWDRQVRLLMRRVGVPALRISVGVVFIWFGGLKVLDVSPVSDLVANTVYWLDASWVVTALGVMEVLVGLCLVTRRFLRLALLWFASSCWARSWCSWWCRTWRSARATRCC